MSFIFFLTYQAPVARIIKLHAVIYDGPQGYVGVNGHLFSPVQHCKLQRRYFIIESTGLQLEVNVKIRVVCQAFETTRYESRFRQWGPPAWWARIKILLAEHIGPRNVHLKYSGIQNNKNIDQYKLV